MKVTCTGLVYLLAFGSIKTASSSCRELFKKCGLFHPCCPGFVCFLDSIKLFRCYRNPVDCAKEDKIYGCDCLDDTDCKDLTCRKITDATKTCVCKQGKDLCISSEDEFPANQCCGSETKCVINPDGKYQCCIKNRKDCLSDFECCSGYCGKEGNKKICKDCKKDNEACTYNDHSICCNRDSSCVISTGNPKGSCQQCSITTEECNEDSDCCYTTDSCVSSECIKKVPDINGNTKCADNLQLSLRKDNSSIKCCNDYYSNSGVCYCKTSGNCNFDEQCCEGFQCKSNKCKRSS